jgi:hypothetical protein
MPVSEWLNSGPENWIIKFRIHATRRMFEREFTNNDVWCCIREGGIIEEYSQEYTFPSVLVNGITCTQRPIHVVLGKDADNTILYVITVYEPSNIKWADNYSRRI